MSNPELERDALDADWQLKAGQADLANTKVRLRKELLDQQAAAATVESDFHQAELQAETNRGLFKEGLVAGLTLQLSEVRAKELATRNEIEKKRVAVYSESEKTQIGATGSRAKQMWALTHSKRGHI